MGAVSESTNTSRNIPYRNLPCAAPILYCLLRFFTLIAVAILDGVRERLFHIAEIEQSADQDERGNSHRDPESSIGAISNSKQCPAKPIDHTGHGIQRIY